MDNLKRNSAFEWPATEWIRPLAVTYLTLQGTGGLAWWGMLLCWPASRLLFTATNAPEATLLALGTPDMLLYVGGSLFSAFGLAARRVWAFPILCVHSGAAAYAALYCLTLWCLDPSTWIGAVVMLPSLVVPPLISWHFRPRSCPRGNSPC